MSSGTAPKKIISILLMVILMIGACTVAASASVKVKDTSVKISNYNTPKNMYVGQTYKIKGKITASTKIKRIEVGIVNKTTNKWTKYKYDKNVNARSFDLSKAQATLKFDKLKAGKYCYRIYVHTEKGATLVVNQTFTVHKLDVSIGGDISPKNIKLGEAFTVKGKITSGQKIDRIEVGIVNKSTNKWTSYKYDNKKVNAKTFNLSKAASKLKFNKLKAGDYAYRIYVHTSHGTALLMNRQFTVSKTKGTTAVASVGEVYGETIIGSSPNGKSSMEMEADNNRTTGRGGNVKLSGFNKPGRYKVGTSFSPKGTITSDKTINRVEIGIVYKATGKWTTFKYDNKKVNDKTFDISTAASKLSFDRLPAGTFAYRIYVHTEDGVYTMLNHTFTVTGSGKAQKALDWAVKIANDNSFSYGTGKACHRCGCYFCGNNQTRKPKGYEKTYVCITFVGAAYAHGAGDPEILARCKQAKLTCYLDDNNFTKVSCWFKLGACKDLTVDDLMPGDVVIRWSDDNGRSGGHAWMYGGGDLIVDSRGEGWGKDTISVHSGAAAQLKRYGKDSGKNYVMRYCK